MWSNKDWNNCPYKIYIFSLPGMLVYCGSPPESSQLPGPITCLIWRKCLSDQCVSLLIWNLVPGCFESRLTLTWNQKLTAVSDFLIKSQYQVECTGKFKGLVTCLSQDLLQNGVCHFRNVESSLFKQTFPTSIITKYWESSRANIFVDIWAERVVET